jgi:hypothetical protein
MTKPAKKLLTGFGALFLAGSASILLLYPPGPAPVCGSLLDAVFQQWLRENHNVTFPNVDGTSTASLALLRPYFGGSGENALQRYGYLPGLRPTDPTNLVLMYLKEKTRFTWHGDTKPTVFSPKLWKIISPGIASAGPDPEGGELVNTPEFKGRIQKTLDFLKAQQRPHWQTVIMEQTQFLDSIKE